MTRHIEHIDHVYLGLAKVDCFVVMPDHIHLIIQLCSPKSGPPRAAAPTVTLPGIINALKGLSSKEIGYSPWQRGYHDHVIRNDADLCSIREYIQNNPLKWILDKD